MISVVLGRRGCGKTTLIRGYVASKPRLLIFDTLAEYGSSGRTFSTIEPMISFVESRQYLQFRAVYQPIDSRDLEEAFSDFMRLCWIVGDCTIVIDEIDQVSSAVSVSPELARNLRYGRHRKLFVIAASRRAAEVPRLITSQADELISFNQTEPRDVKYIEDYAGKTFAAKTTMLPRYHALIYRSFDHTISTRESNSTSETLLANHRTVLPTLPVAEPDTIKPPSEKEELPTETD